eukprot:scaffold605_cov346-Pavlova_lutheri.AAC.2
MPLERGYYRTFRSRNSRGSKGICTSSWRHVVYRSSCDMCDLASSIVSSSSEHSRKVHFGAKSQGPSYGIKCSMFCLR